MEKHPTDAPSRRFLGVPGSEAPAELARARLDRASVEPRSSAACSEGWLAWRPAAGAGRAGPASSAPCVFACWRQRPVREVGPGGLALPRAAPLAPRAGVYTAALRCCCAVVLLCSAASPHSPSAQLTPANQGCCRTSSAPALAPSRCVGSCSARVDGRLVGKEGRSCCEDWPAAGLKLLSPCGKLAVLWLESGARLVGQPSWEGHAHPELAGHHCQLAVGAPHLLQAAK